LAFDHKSEVWQLLSHVDTEGVRLKTPQFSPKQKCHSFEGTRCQTGVKGIFYFQTRAVEMPCQYNQRVPCIIYAEVIITSTTIKLSLFQTTSRLYSENSEYSIGRVAGWPVLDFSGILSTRLQQFEESAESDSVGSSLY